MSHLPYDDEPKPVKPSQPTQGLPAPKPQPQQQQQASASVALRERFRQPSRPEPPFTPVIMVVQQQQDQGCRNIQKTREDQARKMGDLGMC